MRHFFPSLRRRFFLGFVRHECLYSILSSCIFQLSFQMIPSMPLFILLTFFLLFSISQNVDHFHFAHFRLNLLEMNQGKESWKCRFVKRKLQHSRILKSSLNYSNSFLFSKSALVYTLNNVKNQIRICNGGEKSTGTLKIIYRINEGVFLSAEALNRWEKSNCAAYARRNESHKLEGE